MGQNKLENDVRFTEQRLAASDSPISEAQQSTLVLCPQCGAANPLGSRICRATPTCGSFLPANNAAWKSGIYARRPLADPEGTELFQTWAEDLGGIESLSVAQRVLLRRAAEADVVCRTAFHYLSKTGQSWSSRRVQMALQTLATHSNTIVRIAALLGLKLDRAGKAIDYARAFAEQERRRG
jgi:hypothetical protein